MWANLKGHGNFSIRIRPVVEESCSCYGGSDRPHSCSLHWWSLGNNYCFYWIFLTILVHSPLQVAMGERYTGIVRKPRWDLWTLGPARADGSAPIKMPSITSKWGATDSIWCAEMEPHLVGDNNPPPLVDKLSEVRFRGIAATGAWGDSSACARVWYCQILIISSFDEEQDLPM